MPTQMPKHAFVLESSVIATVRVNIDRDGMVWLWQAGADGQSMPDLVVLDAATFGRLVEKWKGRE